MIYLDNIIFELQQNGGASKVWASILVAAYESIPEKISLITGPKALLNSNFPIPMAQIKIVSDPGPVFYRRFRRVNCGDDATIFHSSYFRYSSSSGVKNIVTVHDCVCEMFDSGPRKYLHIRQKVKALKHATTIVCVSHNTKKDLLSFYPWIDPQKVVVVYNGVDTVFSPLQDANVQSKKPYLLYVGGRNAHKNFDAVLKLAETKTSRALGLQVKIVGGGELSPIEKTRINKLGLKESISHLQNVSSKDLNRLYNDAYAFVYPSFYEGFGIPPLEAMAAGCPVVCSNASSIPEVAGDAALYFSPHNILEAEAHLYDLQEDSFRQQLISRGFSRAENFSWKKTGAEIIELYRSHIESP